MLRWICCKSRKDRIKNERIGEHLGIALTGDKLKETRLRCFGHAQRTPKIAQVKISFSMQVYGQSRKKGRLKRKMN